MATNVLSTKQLHKNAATQAYFPLVELTKEISKFATQINGMAQDPNCPRSMKDDLAPFNSFFEDTNVQLLQLQEILKQIARS